MTLQIQKITITKITKTKINNYKKILDPEGLYFINDFKSFSFHRFSFSLFFGFFVLILLCFSFSLYSFPLFQHRFETEVETI